MAIMSATVNHPDRRNMNAVQDWFTQGHEFVEMISGLRRRDVCHTELEKLEALFTWYGVKDASAQRRPRMVSSDEFLKIIQGYSPWTLNINELGDYTLSGPNFGTVIARGPFDLPLGYRPTKEPAEVLAEFQTRFRVTTEELFEKA
jgi:hypothetical protein